MAPLAALLSIAAIILLGGTGTVAESAIGATPATPPGSAVASTLPSSIVALDLDTFEERIAAHVWLVEYYSPRCPHCQRFAPVYEQVAQELVPLRQTHGITLAKFDCTVNKEATAHCMKEKVSGFPTLLLYRRGKQVEEYLGQRTSAEVIAYVRKMADQFGPLPVVPLDSKSFAERTAHGMWVVDFFAPWCPHCKALAPIYEQLAEKYRTLHDQYDLTFATVDCPADKEFCNKMKIEMYPTVRMYKSGVMLAEFEDERTFADLSAFVEKHTTNSKNAPSKGVEPPTLSEQTPSSVTTVEGADVVKSGEANSQQTSKPATPILDASINPTGEIITLTETDFKQKIAASPFIVEFFAPWCGHCKQLAPIWVKVAQSLKQRVNVAAVDCTTQRTLASEQGITAFPIIKYFNGGYEIAKYTDRPTLPLILEWVDSITRY